MTIPYVYQLQGGGYSYWDNLDYRIAVMDMDDSSLSGTQLQALSDQGKTNFTYVSVGEAEDYRDYWTDGNWDSTPPDFLLSENSDWEGNFRVKFWDSDWQDLMVARVEQAVNAGYDGVYLDIIDAYEESEVQNAYGGTYEELRQEMIDFVGLLSAAAKAINPEFSVIPQNAVGLLAIDDDNPDVPNTQYLNSIDGVGVEDLWFDDNNSAGWTVYDVELLQNALDAGKFVLSTSYPTKDGKQETYVNNAIDEGFIPFVGTRELDGTFDPLNYDINDLMDGKTFNLPGGQEVYLADPDAVPGDPVSEITFEVNFGSKGSHTEDSDTTGDDALSGRDMGLKKLTGDLLDVERVDETTLTIDILNPKAAPKVMSFDPTDRDSDITISGDVKKMKVEFAGGDGHDRISLESLKSNDFLYGDAGNDELYSGVGKDKLYGGSGDDILQADGRKSKLYGGLGEDTLMLTGSKNLYAGNEGSDVFRILDGHKKNTIADFQVAGVEADSLDISDLLEGFDSLNDDINEFVMLKAGKKGAVLYVDGDGGGDDWNAAATLKGSQFKEVSVDDLFDNGQILTDSI